MVILRKLEQKDVPYMLEWMHDERTKKFFKKDFINMNEEEVELFIDHSFSDINQNFAIVNEDDNYLGTISLKNIDMINLNAEYAIILRYTVQNRGIAFEASQKLLDYAFNTLKMHKVYLNVLENNQKAKSLYLKLGFTIEGIQKEQVLQNKKYINLEWYGLINHE